MKKILMSLTTMLLAASMVACSGNANDNSTNSTVKDAVQIGLVQIQEHTSLNQIRDAITSELEMLGYGTDRVSIDYQNAQGDPSNLNSICQKFAGEQKDLIVAIATPSALAAAAAAPEIPLIFSAVTDPVDAQLVSNPDAPEGLITGTSDAIPVDQVFALMQQLTPEVKTVGLLYNLGEPNSVSVIKKAKAHLEELGLKYVEATVTNTSEVQQAAQSLVGKCEALYTPIDNTVASAMPVYADVAMQAKLPIYTGADSMVIDGGFATVGINYELLGKQTAAMIAKVIEGTPIQQIPVETLHEFSTVINKSTAAAIGVPLSDEILASAQIVE